MSPLHLNPWPLFPRQLMMASAAEVTDQTMNIIAGSLPKDLQGHLFMVAPVGSVTSNGLPNPSGCHVWNGNGLVYRFDFEPSGEVLMTTRLAKTPCYYADLATTREQRFEEYQFRDFGMARFSVGLGMRNHLNTAFVPMRFGTDDPARLLLTFDGGRPYEIDPCSLKLVTPVGSNDEWRPGVKLPVPFPAVLSTAHPAFDPWTKSLFTVNYGRSMANFLDTIPLLYKAGELPEGLESLLGRISSQLQLDSQLTRLVRPFQKIASLFEKKIRHKIQQVLGLSDFIYILQWDGSSRLRKWRVVDCCGKPLRIDQTMHQIGCSKDFIVLIDSSLKFGIEQILNRPLPFSRSVRRIARALLTRPQAPDTRIFCVRRDQLMDVDSDVISDVVASQVTIPLETSHFLVDYENPNGQVTLHMAHECATDVSEWRSDSDRSPLENKALAKELEGMISVGAMDVGRLGRYVLDANRGLLLESSVVHDSRRTWGLGLYACRDHQANGKQPRKWKSVFWQSLGFWPDLLPESIYRLYEDYPYRMESLNQLWPIPEEGKGRPSSLFRLDTEKMEIADAFDFPVVDPFTKLWDVHIVNSPQFVPRSEPSGVDPDMDGYLICTVISPKIKELWIFDAAHLADGPICRLSHPEFQPGYTVHTTWLPEISPNQGGYVIPVREDYQELLKDKSQKIKELFKQEVYPHF